MCSYLLDLKHLQYLDLSCNDFGSLNIPEFFGSLSTLRYLNLSSAGFCGVIPHQLGNSSKLHYLYIGKSDYYRKDSLNAKDIEWISASSNIYGPIPSGLLNMTSLRFLDLSNNNFASPIPDWLYHITNLEHLDLGSLNIESNNFHGMLPNDIGNLTSITYLDRSYNALEGDILRSLGNLCSFQLSNLSYDRPGKGLELLSLVVLDLSEKEFTGSIPAWMGNCNGKFIDMVPGDAEITYTPGLMVLILHSNKFNGSIPLELCHLDSLQILDLGNSLEPFPDALVISAA
ncbi:Receptor-like protein kinase HAIKU2 [Vitis vinifera]|uniref:Receptor-like protein kinase HAIKU2 n=1 Tax=Vitis vinifera TaxID=29760 RepID=A0A438FVJ8_VITVI|nr:Receptor-like protein kinase HAIKU2 [Vitis vinifera]